MDILSYNPGHDGAVCLIRNGRLVFSVEAEKDSGYRYSYLTVPELLDATTNLDRVPDVLCMSGWWPLDHHEYRFGSHRNGGYRGTQSKDAIMDAGRLFSAKTDYFSSSHERAHILCAFGMSDLPMGTKCYSLVWEGEMGSFYEIDEHLNISLLADVMTQPGNRYGLAYGLADPTFPKDGPYPRNSDAGKLMALASFSTRTLPSAMEQQLIGHLLDGSYRKLTDFDKLVEVPHLNVGFDDTEFKNFAGIFSDAIFSRFLNFAEENLERGRPLIIAGGCGLNCDWNSKWKKSGLFSHVFVPPVANDSGVAIGTAIDAQFRYTGSAKIDWDVYCGLDFHHTRVVELDDYDVFDSEPGVVARLLDSGLILGWVHGKYEIGPRALGNRSILAEPFRDETRIRLNEIKQREQFRPIAPICMKEEAERWFDCDADSPHMLYTYHARTDALAAVTHVNGTARLQTVTPASNAQMYDLLTAFRELTGYGVLCNTSLNFNGKGFINNLTDLDAYAKENDLDGFVVNGKAYLRKASDSYKHFLHTSEEVGEL